MNFNEGKHILSMNVGHRQVDASGTLYTVVPRMGHSNMETLGK